MKNVTNELGATNALANPTTAQICGLRSLIMELILSHPFATTEEWATAAERVYANSNPATLAKWYRNTVRELANREEAAPAAPVVYATGDQKERIICLLNHPAVSRRHKTRVLLTINRLTLADARNEIARLIAYVAAPFGGGPNGAAAGGALVGFILTA